MANSSLFRIFWFGASGGEPTGSSSARLLVSIPFPVDEWPMLIRLFMLLTRWLFAGGFCVLSINFVELLFLYFSLGFWNLFLLV